MDEPGPAADRYLFVLHLLEEGYGGLEHDAGSVLQFGWRQLHRPEGRRQLLQLVAHEYLHQWNVRRLRPRGLVPYDYDTPMLTADLWFAEGITSYLDQFLPFQVGEAGEEELLEDLAKDLTRYLRTPGRSVQSLSLSSQEAWVKLYRRQTGAADHQVSYYLKGAVIALCLDLHLRRVGSALLVVLRDLWRRFGRHGRGYGRDDLLQAFTAAAPDLAPLLPVWLDGHEDPDLGGYLADVGLQLVPREDAVSGSGPHAGLQATRGEGQLVASRVERGGPAARAGCQCGDELLALDGWRLRDPDELNERLIPAGDQELLVCRRGKVHALRLRSESARPRRWTLDVDDAAPGPRHEARRRWLALVP
jgi:predicted metalloprotease with PDZ domain